MAFTVRRMRLTGETVGMLGLWLVEQMLSLLSDRQTRGEKILFCTMYERWACLEAAIGCCLHKM